MIGGKLIQRLIDALMRWKLGSQPTSIRIAGDMRGLIALGDFEYDSDEDNLGGSLSSLFQKQSWRMVGQLNSQPS